MGQRGVEAERTDTGSAGSDREIRVLHVEDDPEVAALTAEFLERKAGVEVLTETDPAAALDRIEADSFDCVVSDYRMPGIDGVDLLRGAREREPDIPFIMFTGEGSEAVASEAISAGVTDYLRKGTGTERYAVLARKVRNAVERQRAVERFESFLESAPDAIIVADADGTIEQVNEQVEELFGYDREELVGEPIETLIPGRFQDDHADYREQYVQDPETRPMGADLDLYALHADGSEFPVDIAISPVQVGGTLEVMAAVRDISTRKWREEQLREREAELERQNERLEEFASVVSHDLRNPLNVAGASIELARETGDLSHLDDARESVDRMETLIEDLLTLAREGESVEDPTTVVLDRVAAAAWASTPTDGAELVAATDAEIRADGSRLRQLLENLFRNSAEHGGEAPTVTVDDTTDGFYVADDGPGIPAEEREQVFESGYSSDREGTGFGLAIVRTIAQAHGWSVDLVESEAGGARFEFTGVESA